VATRLPTDGIYTDIEPEPEWLIPEVLHKGHTILLAGMAGIGKSMFAYMMANALATGSAFAETISPARRILYFDEENGRADLAAYARWTWRGLKCPSRDLLRENLRIECRTLAASEKWGLTMRQIAAEHKPDIILIDTATPACHIQDENDNAEASAACQQIRLAQDHSSPDCASIIFKHLRLDTQTGKVDIRGAKHWKGAVDGIWFHMLRSGPKREDGWRNTLIKPEKRRAYGLQHELHITPRVQPGLFVDLRLSLYKYAAKQTAEA
jgi:RecA-family ATPase